MEKVEFVTRKYKLENGFEKIQRKYEDRTQKWALYKNGVYLTPFLYDCITCIQEGLIRVSLNDKWGFINDKGEVVIPYKYNEAGEFYNGLARVRRKNGKYIQWGFVNKQGEEVIPCKYDYVNNFYEKLSAVCIDGKYGLIDLKGEIVVPIVYYHIDRFHNGLAVIEIDNKFGLINSKGEITLQPIYDRIDKFNGSSCTVRSDDKYGLINENGLAITPCIYNYIRRSYNGLRAVTLNNEWGFINDKGEEIVPCKYLNVDDFTNKNVCRVKKSFPLIKSGFINREGKEIVPCEYIDVTNYTNNLFLIFNSDKYNNTFLNYFSKIYLKEFYSKKGFRDIYNPTVFIEFNNYIVNIGSRLDTLYYQRYKDTYILKTGCFFGDLEEFEEEVKRTHFEGDKYYNQYMKIIEDLKEKINA